MIIIGNQMRNQFSIFGLGRTKIMLFINSNQTTMFEILFSGIAGAVIGGLISGAITFWAMKYIDDLAGKRWLQEGFLKRKVELEVEIIKYVQYFKVLKFDFNSIDGIFNNIIDDTLIANLTEFNNAYEFFVKALNGDIRKEIEELNILAVLDEYIFYKGISEDELSEFRDLLLFFDENKSLCRNGNSESPAHILFGFNIEEIKKDADRICKIIYNTKLFYKKLDEILSNIHFN